MAWVEWPGKRGFTPQAFEASIRAALSTADKYVWVYTETPKWWAGANAKTEHLPQAYEDAVRAQEESNRRAVGETANDFGSPP